MKTIAILLLICMSSFCLYGQNDGPGDRFKSNKPDSILMTPFFKNHNENSDFSSNRILKPDFDLSHKRFSIESPEIKNYHDKSLAERFPGSEKYYARRPHLISPHEKSFVKKPDIIAKQYLIVIDPYTHMRIN